MENLNVLNGNKIIAEFMGYEYIPYDPNSEFKPGWWIKDITKEQQIKEPVFRKIGETKFLCRRHPELRYYNSWGWLMPVIEKILNICTEEDELERYSIITDNIPYIEQTYEKIIEFIKWYNEQTNNKT